MRAPQSYPTEPTGGGRDAWEVTQAVGERSLPIPAVPAPANDATIFLQSVWSGKPKRGTSGCT